MTITRYANPSPLTADKIKPGLVFGWWNQVDRECIGHYEVEAVPGVSDSYAIFLDGEYLCNFYPISKTCGRFVTFHLMHGAGFQAVEELSSYCIIKEAPEESEVSNG